MKEQPQFPRLPPGYFFRVEFRPHYWGGRYRVWLMRRRRFWLPDLLWLSSYVQADSPDLLELLAQQGQELLQELEKELKQLADSAKICGDYPPKQLPKE